ncbi:type III-A CRISPR-associated protein Csm2 [Thermincola potens]|uniref:CRISPR system Cms protein Csm2 n=1 Tax=Thermincola potens (strain JR) TaxID=635013 RepID=D5X8J0_THEPJ|nr:type III-A CRISPR-associated protein Csm2 [Thermincola potens]ADG82866.1 CRISPR-associated protein, Csm2 family [Thermincola potens JR]
MSKDYVKRAAEVIKDLKKENGKMVTTSQIRKFLAGVNAIKNKVQIRTFQGEITEGRLPEDIQREIQALKVKLVYQCGREPKVKTFVEKAKLLDGIDAIEGSTKKFLDFAGYVEALVAYHKYEGGE